MTILQDPCASNLHSGAEVNRYLCFLKPQNLHKPGFLSKQDLVKETVGVISSDPLVLHA